MTALSDTRITRQPTFKCLSTTEVIHRPPMFSGMAELPSEQLPEIDDALENLSQVHSVHENDHESACPFCLLYRVLGISAHRHQNAKSVVQLRVNLTLEITDVLWRDWLRFPLGFDQDNRTIQVDAAIKLLPFSSERATGIEVMQRKQITK